MSELLAAMARHAQTRPDALAIDAAPLMLRSPTAHREAETAKAHRG